MDLNQKYQELAAAHKANLAAFGVKLPRFTGKLGCSLAILYANFGAFVHIDAIKTQLEETGHTLTGTDPVQVRHLSTQKGWWIEKEGKYKHKLVSVQQCLPGSVSYTHLRAHET